MIEHDRTEVWTERTQHVPAAASYCTTIIVWDAVNSTRRMSVNHLLFLEDSCRCSLQHAVGRSVRAAEGRCHTGPARTSRCSVPRACRGRWHTHWCRPHTDAPQTLRWGSGHLFSVTDSSTHTVLTVWYCCDTFVRSCKLDYGVHHCFLVNHCVSLVVFFSYIPHLTTHLSLLPPSISPIHLSHDLLKSPLENPKPVTQNGLFHSLTEQESALCTWPACTGVVTLAFLTDGAVEAGFRVAWRQRRLTVSAGEGCVRAVTAVAETIRDSDITWMSLLTVFPPVCVYRCKIKIC